MRTRKLRSATAGVLALVAGLVFSTAAHADEPSPLGPGRIDDRAGVLSVAEESRLEERLEALASSDGLPELFVVLVPDFEEPENALSWADETAQQSNLAPDQYLLAIATEGRSLAISAEYGGGDVAAGPLSETRILEIEDRLGSDFLSHDDWAGGINYVADEFSATAVPWWVWLVGALLLAVIVFAVTRLVLFLRRRARLAAELRTLEGQKKRTAQRLVQADEAVRTSEQELGFVTAEFGDEATAEFAAVLTENRARLQQGFQLLEKLQDADEDTSEETRAWVDEILELCTRIDAALEDRAQQIASLRALEKAAPAHLTRLRAARADASHLQPLADERLRALAAAYAPADLVGVERNAEEIGERLRAADVQLDVLQKAVESRRPRVAVQAVHEVERLLAEAKDLRDAVDAQAVALAARPTARPAVQSDTSVPAAGDAAVSEGAGDPASAGGSLLEQATAAVRAAETSVQARSGDVGSFALMRLSAAQRELAVAQSTADGDGGDLAARTALATAQQVQALIGAPTARASARFVRPAPAASPAIMYDVPETGSRSGSPRSYYADPDDEGRSGKAVLGGLSGGAIGFFGSLGVARDAPGVIVLFVIGGVVLGAISGAFGNGGDGGSSSGWGGSSRSSGRWSSGGSRSGGSSRGGSRSSGGGSRSSGRSGGRRF